MQCYNCTNKIICKLFDYVNKNNYALIEIKSCKYFSTLNNTNTVFNNTQQNNNQGVQYPVKTGFKMRPNIRDLFPKKEPEKIKCPSCEAEVPIDEIKICPSCGKKVCSCCGNSDISTNQIYCDECWSKKGSE